MFAELFFAIRIVAVVCLRGDLVARPFQLPAICCGVCN